MQGLLHIYFMFVTCSVKSLTITQIPSFARGWNSGQNQMQIGSRIFMMVLNTPTLHNNTWTLHVIFLIRDRMAVLAAFLLVTVTGWNSTNYLLHSLLRSGVWCCNTSWWQHQPTRPSQSTGTLKWVLPAQWRSLWFVYHNKSDYYFVELASFFFLYRISCPDNECSSSSSPCLASQKLGTIVVLFVLPFWKCQWRNQKAFSWHSRYVRTGIELVIFK